MLERRRLALAAALAGAALSVTACGGSVTEPADAANDAVASDGSCPPNEMFVDGGCSCEPPAMLVSGVCELSV